MKCVGQVHAILRSDFIFIRRSDTILVNTDGPKVMLDGWMVEKLSFCSMIIFSSHHFVWPH